MFVQGSEGWFSEIVRLIGSNLLGMELYVHKGDVTPPCQLQVLVPWVPTKIPVPTDTIHMSGYTRFVKGNVGDNRAVWLLLFNFDRGTEFHSEELFRKLAPTFGLMVEVDLGDECIAFHSPKLYE